LQILVAEDDRDIAGLIAHYMQKSGWQPHIATSGDEALAHARKQPVDVAILDVMLPGISGLEVCRLLRADRATATLPIIMVTARAEETDRIMGLEIGADDYISKPFSPNELVARVRALMRRMRRMQARTHLRVAALLTVAAVAALVWWSPATRLATRAAWRHAGTQMQIMVERVLPSREIRP